MGAPVYIGDEVSGAGFRLAGLRVVQAPATGLSQAVSAACEGAALVLLSAAVAARLPAGVRERLLAQLDPPVVVVPDVHRGTPIPDLATRLRAQLGVLE